MATLVIPCDPKIVDLFGTANIPRFTSMDGTNGPVSGYAFSDTTMQQVFVKLTAWDFLSGNVTVRLRWASPTGVTTNEVVWGAQMFAITPGDAQSVLTDAFATAATTTTTVNSTASGDTETIITITSVDSLAAGDDVWLRIYRDAAAGGDDMTGEALLFGINVSYAANSGGGSGDVTGPGSATDNAVVRFDSTTGKVVQNSAVIVDDSGNITGAGTLNTKTIANFADPASPATGDVPYWNGTIWVPKCRATVTLASDHDVTSALTDTAVAQALRVGRHLVYVSGNWTTDNTARDFGFALNFSGTATMHMEGVVYATATTGTFGNVSAFNSMIVSTATASSGTPLAFRGRAEVIVTVAGTLVLRVDTDSDTGTVLAKAGSGMSIFET